jgi:ABC-2 type transport system ATP-binding protein
MMIKATGLKKNYSGHPALQGISFDINKGEFYGLLGPNGAGKTTTIGILSTIIVPDEGEVEINGFNLKKQPALCKKSMGVVPQEIALYGQMTAYDNLMFWGGLYNVNKGVLKEKVSSLLHLFGLYDRRNDVINNYSGGMKRRINIASALLHSPEILFMDEPTVGIDPQSRNLIFEVIEKLHKEGLTIIYTTHYMEEAERFCDRIGIIDKGLIIAQGTLNELKKAHSVKESIVINTGGISEDQFNKIKSGFNLPVAATENLLTFQSSNIKDDLSRVIIRSSEAGVDIKHIDIQKINLETVFLGLTGKQLRD